MHLQRVTGNQAVQRSLSALEVVSDVPAVTRFTHDFSRIPVHSETPVGPLKDNDWRIDSSGLNEIEQGKTDVSKS